MAFLPLYLGRGSGSKLGFEAGLSEDILAVCCVALQFFLNQQNTALSYAEGEGLRRDALVSHCYLCLIPPKTGFRRAMSCARP